jgi:hypothetical protein
MSTGTISWDLFNEMLENPSKFLPGLKKRIDDETDPTRKEQLIKLVDLLSKPIASATLNGGKSRRRRRHRRSSKKHKKARKSRRRVRS